MPLGHLYTKSGDTGQTSLLGGERVRKDSPRTEAYGTIDELNSWLGLVEAELGTDCLCVELREIQAELLEAGARLASTEATAAAHELSPPGEAETTRLEISIDRMLNELPTQKTFILPGGCRVAASAQVARTVCRRAERRLITLMSACDEPDLRQMLIYINRLSDYLYALARTCNHLAGVREATWERRGRGGTSCDLNGAS